MMGYEVTITDPCDVRDWTAAFELKTVTPLTLDVTDKDKHVKRANIEPGIISPAPARVATISNSSSFINILTTLDFKFKTDTPNFPTDTYNLLDLKAKSPCGDWHVTDPVLSYTPNDIPAVAVN
jgi:hypothetical protein